MLSKRKYKQIFSPMLGIISMCFLLLITVGCEKKTEEVEILEVSTSNPVVLATGGDISLEINSNASWKVGKIEADWLQVTESEGMGNGQIKLSCEKNESVEARSTEFFIVTRNTGEYQKITLTQLATDPFIALEQHEIEVGSRPRNHTIGLNSNIPAAGIHVEIVFGEEEESWITKVNVESGKLNFQTTLNSLPEDRTATIILSYEDLSDEDLEVWDKITVKQFAKGNDGPPEYVDLNYVKGLGLGNIDENIAITGNIVSTGISDNFRKNTYIIQDENNVALAFESTTPLVFGKYDKVSLLLDGAELTTFEDCGTLYRVVKDLPAESVLKKEADPDFLPPALYIDELKEEHLLSLVTLKEVEFAIKHGAYANFHEFYMNPTFAYADFATKHYPAPIRDKKGNTTNLITNREVSYRRKSIPKGGGSITGLVVKIMNSAYQNLEGYTIRHLEESAVNIDPNEENGFSKTLVEWELPITNVPAAPNTLLNLPATRGPGTATLQKDGSPGFFPASGTMNGVFLIDKYRGDQVGTTTIIGKSGYNVNSWGTGRYWILDNVSTEGITTALSVQFESNSSDTGPKEFAVEYSLNGTNWVRVGTYNLSAQIAANVSDKVIAGQQMFSFRLPDELLNKPKIKIRLINISNAAARGVNQGIPGGTSRLMHFSIRYNK